MTLRVDLHQEPGGGTIPDVHRGEVGEEGKLVMGSCRRQNKLEIIETELQRLVWHGLDRLRVFHTFFRYRVTLLVERMRPMWEYSGPMDPDRASPEELPKDEV